MFPQIKIRFLLLVLSMFNYQLSAMTEQSSSQKVTLLGTEQEQPASWNCCKKFKTCLGKVYDSCADCVSKVFQNRCVLNSTAAVISLGAVALAVYGAVSMDFSSPLVAIPLQNLVLSSMVILPPVLLKKLAVTQLPEEQEAQQIAYFHAWMGGMNILNATRFIILLLEDHSTGIIIFSVIYALHSGKFIVETWRACGPCTSIAMLYRVIFQIPFDAVKERIFTTSSARLQARAQQALPI